MTENPNDEINEALREALRAARDRRGAIPGDVVPKPPVTDEQLIHWHDMAGQPVNVTDPGEVLLDPDGLPIGVEESTTTQATLARPLLTAEQKARLEHLLAQRDNEETP